MSFFDRIRMGTEGKIPSLDGATAWINSEPLTPEALDGRVVAFDFCTYTCINWLRTLPYVRAWSEKYGEHGFTVVGIHTPEFPFEHDLDNIRPQLAGRGVDYPVAVDNDYAVWRAFSNNYWPALYIADRDGDIRYHHFGEGAYEESEREIQSMLGFEDDLVDVEPLGDEVSANWDDVRSPETYLGYERAEGFASPGGASLEARTYELPERSGLNQWALAGEWTMQLGNVRLDKAGGRLAFRFHARDVNLIMGAPQPVGFLVTVDGQQLGASHGVDTDEHGNGTVHEPRMYQLVRTADRVTERTFEIEFAEQGVGAYCFTFG
jgi:thiol-disulfide isomerase/thioredoxin